MDITTIYKDSMEFPLDIATLKRNIEREIDSGFIEPGKFQEIQTTINLLQRSMATEIICAYRYKDSAHKAENLGATIVSQKLNNHADEEWLNAENLAQRISQLGGHPEYDPIKIQHLSHIEFKSYDTMDNILKENLFSAKLSATIYRRLVKYFGDHDPVTKHTLVSILLKKEAHIDFLYVHQNKNAAIDYSKIQFLKEAAEEQAMKIVAEDDGMTAPSRKEGVMTQDYNINDIVSALNDVDNNFKHSVSDFIPVK